MRRRSLGKLFSLSLFLTAAGCGGGGDEGSSQGNGDSSADNPDATPVVIQSGPAKQTWEGAATVVFDAQPGKQYECDVDNRGYQACSNPYYIRDMVVGDHVMRVRETGLPETESTYQWTVTSVFDGNIELVQFDGVVGAPDPDGGTFRIKCEVSHFNYDDALVSPNQPNAAHLHMYLGNTQTDNASDIDSLASTGEGSCDGGMLNRSGYWVPTMLYPLQNPPDDTFGIVLPLDDVDAVDVYYKSNITEITAIQPMPSGLQMISGDAGATPANPQTRDIIRWSCESWVITSGDDFALNIPRCAVGDWVRATVLFPSCWDGVNLDSADHKSHMAFPVFTPGQGHHCPASHPVTLTQVSYNLAYEVTAENSAPFGDSRMWRLASDTYEVSESVPGGYSLHGDWMMAWHPEIMQTWIEHCIHAGIHCAGGELGNGWRLRWHQPEQITEPDLNRPTRQKHQGH